MKPDTIAQPILLLGEGKDEVAVFERMLKVWEIGNVQTLEYGGKGNIHNYMTKVLPKVPRLFSQAQVIGITGDADDDPRAANDRLSDAANRLKQSFADVGQPPPVIRQFVFPGAGADATGALESLVWRQFSDTFEVRCVDEYLKCMGAKVQGYNTSRLAKAKIHSLLSAVNPDKTRLGQAVSDEVFDFEHEIYNPFRSFVDSLVKALPKV